MQIQSRRNTELWLLLLAAIPVTILFVLVGAGAGEEFSSAHFLVPGLLFGLFIVAHLAVRRFAPNADPSMLPIVFSLSSTGIAFIIRLVPDNAFNQLIWLSFSIVAFVLVMWLVPSIEKLGNYKYLMMLAGLVLVLSPILIGKEINGSKLWIVFGGFSFQPGEIGRIFIILFLAAYLAENREMLSISTRKVAGIPLPEMRVIGPVLMMWAVSFVIMIAQKDLGSSLLFFSIFLIMVYVATGRLSYIFVGLGLFGVGAFAAYKTFAHVQTRVSIWLDPFSDPAGKAYQLVQSQFAFADGGLLGTGVGQGVPTRIPFVDTDFIFSAIGEELGLLGAGAILLLFLALIYRTISVAARAKSDVASFSAVGLAASFGVQVFVIVGGVTGLIPLTGITVPFISRGGSSLLASMIMLALLLRAGDETTGVASELNPRSAGSGALGRRVLTSRLTTISILVGLVFASLITQLTWLQVINARDLRNNEYNTRNLMRERYNARGAILTSDGITLAESRKQNDDTYLRNYPQGNLASHILGYYSEKRGRSGIEAAANDALSGTRRLSTIQDAINEMVGEPVQGDNVVLTIDSRIQKAAEKAIAGSTGKGSIVVLDPRSGAVLASASNPNFSPENIDNDWEALQSNDDSPLLDRSRQSLTAPGSTFKVVTLTGAYELGIAHPLSKYPAPGKLEIGNAFVTNFEKSSYSSVDVKTATAKSINTVFAQLADEMGPANLVKTANGFGFNESIPYELDIKTSLMPNPLEMTEWETAWAGVGQPVGEHESPAGPQTNTFQMALVAAGIANEGKIMRPYLIENIKPLANNAVPYAGSSARVWKTATTPETAKLVKEAMVEVVASGSGRGASLSGVVVAGKTGTAEVGKNAPTNAWFIAFAPADNPKVALAIMLEGAGQGGRLAAPASRAVIQTALEVLEEKSSDTSYEDK